MNSKLQKAFSVAFPTAAPPPDADSKQWIAFAQQFFDDSVGKHQPALIGLLPDPTINAEVKERESCILVGINAGVLLAFRVIGSALMRDPRCFASVGDRTRERGAKLGLAAPAAMW